MKELIEISVNTIQATEYKFKRYLIDQVRWNNRLIAITGARGCGKTTLLLQHAKELNLESGELLYISLDDLFLKDLTIRDIAGKFYKNGGKLLFLDEVHKYPHWSLELKNIYDTYPNLKVAFTGSSVLEIYKGEADLSRRAIEYKLHNLSLREYIAIKEGINLPIFTLTEILENHTKLALQITDKLRPLKYYNEYIEWGAFPNFKEDIELYHRKLLNTINLSIETDLMSVSAIDFAAIVKLKQLVGIIAESVPFKPNILKLSERLGVKRDTLIKYLQLLERARILALLNSAAKGINQLTKPDKIYLQNPNILYAIAGDKANIGTLRETFFLNQLLQSHVVNYIEKGDFLIDNKWIFEIGGSNKTRKQIKEIPNSYLVADDIEVGSYNTIPIWLFGFMY
jgi:predicted AAA+ superfamily ATPase